MDKVLTWPELGWSNEITYEWTNGPSRKTAKILDRALELTGSVPYRVTLRWLFYGLWQEGWFNDQKPQAKKSAKAAAYGNFIQLLSRLRHSPDRFQDRWPIDLADDRRDPIHRTDGFASADEWLDYEIKNTVCNIDKMVGQDHYVMVAFEAVAMQSQFVYLTEPYGVTLWPFGGKASIPYKQKIASHIEWLSQQFGLPIIVLYFGDYDKTGEEIPESAFRHVRKWCGVDFKAYRAGLNWEQVKRFGIEEDVEKTGKFQWEAVRGEAAELIVRGALDGLLYHDAIKAIVDQEESATTKARAALREVEL